MSALKELYLKTLKGLRMIPEVEFASMTVEGWTESQLLEGMDAMGADVVERVLERLGEDFYVPTDGSREMPLSLMEGGSLEYADAVKYGVIPLSSDGSGLKVGLANPLELENIDDLAEIYGRVIEPVLIRADVIERVLEDWAQVEGWYAQRKEGGMGEGGRVMEVMETTEEVTIVHYVERLIEVAVMRGASDIHLEPMGKGLRIRIRIDGHLEVIEPPASGLQNAIISRIKLMANMSIAEKRQPQDGRIRQKVAGKPIDLRVSSVRSLWGETLVLRILDRERLIIGLKDLGMDVKEEDLFEEAMRAADGLFLVTGPTGSGKSTTLYAVLDQMNRVDRKIITIEDPVEYGLTGINQVQVNRDLGLHFTTALRGILRQAPNVIMVGEIRDKETAEVAMNASLTGHMVYSTLHTNDAPSSVLRLIEMGVKPFLIASALRGVLAQRLIRLICPDCRKEQAVKLEDWQWLKTKEAPPKRYYVGEGCGRCRKRGYRGRTGLFELMLISRGIEALIYREADIPQIREKAREEGMKTLREAGIAKILQGVTTIEEILGITLDEPA